MTVAIPEATGTAEAFTGRRAVARGRHARSGPNVAARGRHAAPVAAPRASAANVQARTGQRGRPGRDAGPRDRSRRPAMSTPRSNYQPVILAEFVTAIILVAATPFASSKDKTGLSPYGGQDVVRFAALILVYLILALMSVGGRGGGRVAAWFGGLILIGVGLSEAANIAKVLNVFGASPAGTETAPAGSGSSSGAGAGGQLV
jgi:hypothetical protein